ncbi:hypothetical protein MGYG_05321 [Nannizzia gypsea CBS 118893]|uniref:Uncharacterized protein n=1 Tax=Arthroderma gypseum (strain ATCC MYA-4604 / CBS 118893) TaxID=535722 RepID=E4UVJ7_ARTGP|nr:hypothetical protein MGYG_05321 [Nannizzia gypsea CBS 118893]EFR02324.1 hypothetical protein MGYG_05321 [Nannizzia gypsea CBS 118893]
MQTGYSQGSLRVRLATKQPRAPGRRRHKEPIARAPLHLLNLSLTSTRQLNWLYYYYRRSSGQAPALYPTWNPFNQDIQ